MIFAAYVNSAHSIRTRGARREFRDENRRNKNGKTKMAIPSGAFIVAPTAASAIGIYRRIFIAPVDNSAAENGAALAEI